MSAKPDLDISFPFQLRIGRVVPDATGRVVVHPHGDKPVVFDPDSANNAAEVIVTPTA
ncbi:hypothetical protein AB0I51_18705 [Streptomyces sp. NPDC050549]|uniref:hypothetical protein n=1 Tax=Streptomyces sp. NPDC050549 TaxID=3155406 RepID=UPI00344543D7